MNILRRVKKKIKAIKAQVVIISRDAFIVNMIMLALWIDWMVRLLRDLIAAQPEDGDARRVMGGVAENPHATWP